MTFLVRLEHFVGITLAFNLSSHHTTLMSSVVPALTVWKTADTAKPQLLSFKANQIPFFNRFKTELLRGMNYLLSREATPPGNGALHPIKGMSTVVSNTDESGHESITPAKPTAYTMGSVLISATQQPDWAAPETKPRSNLAAPQDAEDGQHERTPGHRVRFDIFNALQMPPGAS